MAAVEREIDDHEVHAHDEQAKPKVAPKFLSKTSANLCLREDSSFTSGQQEASDSRGYLSTYRDVAPVAALRSPGATLLPRQLRSEKYTQLENSSQK
uniref:Uncharacterized protein n=1 Tax=Utricularia reniformis TaxID=192314 RepID=A0A1Y0AYX3_9LAMI|nr:hypothetical protein AEK19_MT1254 [Utricularia reniformis]ART30362.1 hypothetical protein AEK19_MT1254 [Utricularia reniformis]